MEIKEAEFFAEYEKAKTVIAAEEKKAINTAPFSLEEQLERFRNNTFTAQEETSLYEDIKSVWTA